MRSLPLLVLAALGAAGPALADGDTKVGPPVGQDAPRFRLPPLQPQDPSRERLVALDSWLGVTDGPSRDGIVLMFAASYCAPCLEELEALPQYLERWRARGVLPVVVVIDTEEDGIASMRKRLARLQAPTLLDRRAILARRYRADLLPMAVRVTAEGRVAWVAQAEVIERLDRRIAGP